jgi:hypothetical protein
MTKSFENRKFDRVRTEHLIIQYKHENDENVYEVEVINLAAGGICFLRNSVLTKGDTIKILFPFKSKKIVLLTKILRVEGRETAGKFEDNQDKIDSMIKLFNEEYQIIKKEREEKEKLEKDLYANKHKYINDKHLFDL